MKNQFLTLILLAILFVVAGMQPAAAQCYGTTKVLTTLSGTIEDGSGELPYNNNQNCKWRIEVPQASSIKLQIAGITESLCDYVYIYDGADATAPLLATLNGTFNQTIQSSSGYVFINFTSDNSTVQDGWVINYAATNIVEYTYDLSGNRTNRKTIEMPTSTFKSGVVSETGNKNKEKPKEDAIGSMQIKIYPNPTDGLLKINCTNLPTDVAGSIALFDMQGKEIYSSGSLTQSNEVDISEAPSGTYILCIVNGDKSTNWKIIKR